MKVAVFADSHIKKGEQFKQRIDALRFVIDAAEANGVEEIVCAGDFFDSPPYPYDEINCLFDGRCVRLHIIPGNHDLSEAVIDGRRFIENIVVYTKPSYFDKDDRLLFVPYEEGSTVVKAVISSGIIDEGQEFNNALEGKTLISHGDFLSTYFPIVKEGYFPLFAGDVVVSGLKRVILGHIHQPPLDMTNLPVVYTGSLAPVSLSETGLRSFFIYDVDSDKLQRIFVEGCPAAYQMAIRFSPSIEYGRAINDAVERFVSEYAGYFSKAEGNTARIIIEGITSTPITDVLRDVRDAFIKAAGGHFEQVDIVNRVRYADERIAEIFFRGKDVFDRLLSDEKVRDVFSGFSFEQVCAKAVELAAEEGID